ncbi:hypothetical protein [Pseudoduganella albidiflava]|uniref:Uncharacterized protein n=1 Tax=Pseudoduganella albidiflava TaxID=321983 RepID=A0A411WZG4_9BURK|nr:hypothetical protein [Pseudoduganella albidiflava]QBI02088.1 hypothetical protein EYF70_15415 [Pseudoduganella albidiflava]GGY65477.1 hypothetical protein GCM10007387_54750 [Pseudoduganella albidiflava]
MNLQASNSPAICRTMLRDGRVLSVAATVRPRANRADVKCVVPGAPALAERIVEVVRLARLTEARLDSRVQLVLGFDAAPQDGERNWELAAVLADRMARGAWQPPHGTADLIALGWSDAWQLGRVDGYDAPPALPEALSPGTELLLGGAGLPHLGALTGHADPGASVSSVRTWFPLHSGGINDTLAWVEVSVSPLAAAGVDAAGEEEDTIAVPGVDAAAQLAVRQALAGARHGDARGLGRWRTVVRFSEPRFTGASYQFALVMADRLARGREFVPRGRLIATGTSAAWHAGLVDTVAGAEAKLALILAEAAAGDRVLLPGAWRDALPPGWREALRAKGASCACVDRIGLI